MVDRADLAQDRPAATVRGAPYEHKRRANADGHRHQQGEAAYGDAQAHPSVRHSPLLGRNPGTKSCKDAPYTDRDESKGIGDIGHEDDGSNRHE